MAAPQTGTNIALGTLYMILAALLLALGATSARFAAGGMNVFTLVFWSNLGMFILMCAWVFVRPPAGGIGTKRLPQHFLRSVFTTAALVTYFYALARIPFANAVILQSMGPLFVPVLALIVFRRLSDRYVWLGVLISFFGVAMIVQPGQPGQAGMSPGDAAAVLAALGGAAAALVIWSLSTTEPPVRQMFYFSLFALLLSAIPLVWIWDWAWIWNRAWDWDPPYAAQVIPILCIAAFTIIGQYFYAKAFAAAPGDKVNTWSYMTIVFAAIIGFIAWDEPILAMTAFGACLVVGGAHLATRERRLADHADSAGQTESRGSNRVWGPAELRRRHRS
ncbi:DMT family transporter [Denitrobaculum tricleocarpae]|uniref:DMT family transporter n=1 Tax=Denitrobaculum tricleocarpae TaxID=2591009 RepID=A0A545SXP3_9PROT|nr:DMT family transporter [Denitrobaculum tricleocarpae]TQV69730.1 DMT family transporter [Denitrobaculum tricleocarpae]